MMERNLYLIMNKPVGYVCSALSDSHKTVYELLPLEMQSLVQNAKRGHRLHTIGRLDCDTSGLLLLTTDGSFSHKVATSRKIGGAELEKTYKVELARNVSQNEQVDYQTRAAQGIVLPPEKKFGKQKAAPAKIEWLGENQCEITVTEGKFHEVRRLFRALGNEVVKLERIAIGGLHLPKELKPGKWRELNQEEMSLLV